MTDYAFIQNILHGISIELANYLNRYLPKLGDDWWYTRVVPNLPVYQQEIAQKDNLRALDFAALLKVFDKNWDELKKVVRLEYILRNYIKEAQTIRNTWAHPPADGNIPENLVFRQLDTLHRLCEGIKASPSLIGEIKQAEIKYLNIIYSLPEKSNEVKPAETDVQGETEKTSPESDIKIGALVRLISKPDQIGSVVEIFASEKETRYKVFVNNKIQQWYHSQIEVIPVSTGEKAVSLKEFNAYLTATQIQSPMSKSLFSLNAAKIDIIPHQFRPVLKFIKSDIPRLLIADGVGVGKTIEAGLILKELEARNDIQSVLIICPKPLVVERKWQDEMSSKFGEPFVPLDSATFRSVVQTAKINPNGWPMDSQYCKVIIPYSILTERNLEKEKTYPGLLHLPEKPKFDLVIVDEAHHIRNSSTKAYEAVKYFVDNADAAVFLTATPIQMGNEDLYTLLNLLAPDLVPNWQVFELMLAPNSFVNQAISELRAQNAGWEKRAKIQLGYAAKTPWGSQVYPANPVFRSVIEQLEKTELTDEERVSLLTDMETLHTFSPILSRTRRRDIDSCYATRKSITVESPFLPEQKKVYDEIIRIQAEILSIIQEDTPVAFMIKTIQRRAASCLPGLLPFLEEILTRHIPEYDIYESDYYGEDKSAEFGPVIPQIKKVLELANKLPDVDLKYDRLREILDKKKTQNPHQVMIFSTFRHTLSYLADRLTADDFRVGIIHGSVADEDRRYLRERFSAGEIDVMLFSEVGCEGLDYQFCDCMINYDLPWNPMKIEQRIGRIDRTGQKSQTVSIFNMITPDTVDAEIYNRCLLRIGVFEESIGGNEVILGDIAKAIEEIADNFILSDEEKSRRLSQLNDNEIRQFLEKKKLEDSEGELFGLALPVQQMTKEMENATSFWLSPESLENLLKVYFRKRFDPEKEYIKGPSSSKKLRLNSKERAQIKSDSRELLKKGGYGSWKRWLKEKGEDDEKDKKSYYSISFDPKQATEDSDLLTPVHPLVKLAVAYLSSTDELFTTIKVKDAAVAPGKYPFAVYLWEYSGVLTNQKLTAVSENDVVAAKLFEYLKDGESGDSDEVLDSTVKEEFEDKLYELWKDELEHHKKKTHDIIEARIASLNQNYQSRLTAIDKLIESSTSNEIIDMRNKESKNVSRELESKLEELRSLETTADIEKRLIGYGVVEVE